MLQELISTVLQLAVFTLIPLIGYLIRKRKFKGFAQDLGLKPSPFKPLLIALLIALPNLLWAPMVITQMPGFMEVMSNPKSLTGRFMAMGPTLEAILLILLVAGIKTALSEEVLFRGFLAKRLIAWLGFWPGNIIQAVIFGAIHTLLFLAVTSNWVFLVFIFLLPTTVALVAAWLNERMADGSILPGWVAHGAGNFCTYLMFALAG